MEWPPGVLADFVLVFVFDLDLVPSCDFLAFFEGGAFFALAFVELKGSARAEAVRGFAALGIFEAIRQSRSLRI